MRNPDMGGYRHDEPRIKRDDELTPEELDQRAKGDISLLSEERKQVVQGYLTAGKTSAEAMEQIRYLNYIEMLKEDLRQQAEQALAEGKTHKEAYESIQK